MRWKGASSASAATVAPLVAVVARVALVALIAMASAALAGCASTGSGVSTREATQRDGSEASGPVSSADPSTPTSPSTPGTDTSASPATPSTDTHPPGSSLPADVPKGALGVGDVLFPDLGNAGIDVTHYDVDVAYDRSTKLIKGHVALDITASSDLPKFSLDAVGLDVDDVAIDGADVEFLAFTPELIITPAATIAAETAFTVDVDYSAKASIAIGPAGEQAGWFESDLGSFVLNEPDGARTWLPSNDHPSDKATYHFTIRVEKGLTGVANGSLVSHTTEAGDEVWVWDQPEQMTTYLVQILTGPFDLVEGQGPGGLPLTSAILSKDQAVMQPFLDVTSQQLDFFDDYFGTYPLDSYGIAMTDGEIGGAIEEQGRSLFSRSNFIGGELGYEQQLLLSHELGHQWFGDSVSPDVWQDIWLNESFATYAEWMWLDHVGLETVDQAADRSLAQRHDSSTVATGLPGREQLFGFEVYEGGAVVLQALRLTIGDDAFFTTLQRWSHDNYGTSKTSADFIALASAISGQDLTEFFDDWLYAVDLPDQYPS